MSEVQPEPTANATSQTSRPRPISWKLGLGILFIPHIFAWATLRQGHSAMQRKVAFGWLVVALAVAALGGGGGRADPSAASASLSATPAMQKPAAPIKRKGEVSAEDFGVNWPFKVHSGRVHCIGKNEFGAAYFTDDRGTTYALNGFASGCLKKRSPYCPDGPVQDIAPIWLEDPNNPALKISIGPLISAALKNCSDD